MKESPALNLDSQSTAATHHKTLKVQLLVSGDQQYCGCSIMRALSVATRVARRSAADGQYRELSLVIDGIKTPLEWDPTGKFLRIRLH